MGSPRDSARAIRDRGCATSQDYTANGERLAREERGPPHLEFGEGRRPLFDAGGAVSTPPPRAGIHIYR